MLVPKIICKIASAKSNQPPIDVFNNPLNTPAIALSLILDDIGNVSKSIWKIFSALQAPSNPPANPIAKSEAKNDAAAAAALAIASVIPPIILGITLAPAFTSLLGSNCLRIFSKNSLIALSAVPPFLPPCLAIKSSNLGIIVSKHPLILVKNVLSNPSSPATLDAASVAALPTLEFLTTLAALSATLVTA